MTKIILPLMLVLGMAGAPALTAGAAHVDSAADSTTDSTTESSWRLGVAFGYGQRSNPLAYSDPIPLVVDVDIAWFGRRWFFDNGDVGFTLVDRDRYTLNLIGRLNSDRVFFSKTNTPFISINNNFGEPVEVQVEVPDRDYAIETGIELLADGGWGYIQAAAFRDISGTHNGYELYLNYSYLFRRHRWVFEPSIGLSWKSGNLNDYYWGVQPEEASLVFPAYHAGGGMNHHVRLKGRYVIDKHWSAICIAEYEKMNSQASASPIVEESRVFGLFAGFKYDF